MRDEAADPRPSPRSKEWVELACELSNSEFRRLVAFYNRGIRSGLSAASPRHVLAVMREMRRSHRMMVAQVERSVVRTRPLPPDAPSLN